MLLMLLLLKALSDLKFIKLIKKTESARTNIDLLTTLVGSGELTTTAKNIVGAINEHDSTGMHGDGLDECDAERFRGQGDSSPQ